MSRPTFANIHQWIAHHAEKWLPSMSLSCVDLFCGAGGLSHGFMTRGIPINVGIDIDPECRYPFEYNNNSRFVQRDIASLSGDELATWYPARDVRILAGCAPCQPFSTYRQRADIEQGQKWSLLREFARLVTELRPDIVTMENVPPLQRHIVFEEFLQALDAAGYAQPWCRTVECRRYGVPQYRRRLVLLASRFGQIEMIPPTHEPDDTNLTVRARIGHLPRLRDGDADAHDPLHRTSQLSEDNRERIRQSRPGGSWRDWESHLVAACHRRRSGKTYPSVYGRMAWDEPAPTLTTQCYAFGSGRFGHPEQDRALSLREAAILQSFPENYAFVAPGIRPRFKVIGRLIGNAVPVALGAAIAESILAHLRHHRLH